MIFTALATGRDKRNRPRVYTMWGKGKDLARSFKRELTIYQKVLTDSRTPIQAKIFLGLAGLSLHALRFDSRFHPSNRPFG
jgi:hypothetical protein